MPTMSWSRSAGTCRPDAEHYSHIRIERGRRSALDESRRTSTMTAAVETRSDDGGQQPPERRCSAPRFRRASVTVTSQFRLAISALR